MSSITFWIRWWSLWACVQIIQWNPSLYPQNYESSNVLLHNENKISNWSWRKLQAYTFTAWFELQFEFESEFEMNLEDQLFSVQGFTHMLLWKLQSQCSMIWQCSWFESGGRTRAGAFISVSLMVAFKVCQGFRSCEQYFLQPQCMTSQLL